MAYLIGILVVEHGLESLSRGRRLSSGAGRGLRPKECPRQPTHVADGVTTVTLSSAVALTVIAADPQATTRARTQQVNGGDDHPSTHAYTHTHTHTHTYMCNMVGAGGFLPRPRFLEGRGATPAESVALPLRGPAAHSAKGFDLHGGVSTAQGVKPPPDGSVGALASGLCCKCGGARRVGAGGGGDGGATSTSALLNSDAMPSDACSTGSHT